MGIIKYDKLFKMLRLRDIKINDLVKNRIITAPTASKLKKNKNVYTDVLVRLCDYLECDITDILDYEAEKSDIIYDETESENPFIFSDEEAAPRPEEQSPEPTAKETKPVVDEDPDLISVSGIWYKKSRLEYDKIHYPHKFIANETYPNICPETGYAYLKNDLCVIERPDDPNM